jgi:hypothetical protein
LPGTGEGRWGIFNDRVSVGKGEKVLQMMVVMVHNNTNVLNATEVCI